jgi:hypothetical protein
MQLTSNTRAFIEAEQYSDFILLNLHDGLLPETFYRNVADFMMGDTLHIKTIGSVTLQESAEDTPLVYNPIESGEITFRITEYVGDAWKVSDDLREDGAQVEQLMAARSVESTRALQERFETDYLNTAASVFASATTGMPVNGFNHFKVASNTNKAFDLDYLIDMRLAADKANVPAAGRVFIVDPVVEATLNKLVSITNDVTDFAKNILERGLAAGQRFITSWFGWDILTSNRLYVGAANDGTTTITSGVFNIGMCILDDQTKPLMGAWRRQPSVSGDRDFERRADKFQTTSRYGFGIQRIDTLFCIVTSPTATTAGA